MLSVGEIVFTEAGPGRVAAVFDEHLHVELDTGRIAKVPIGKLLPPQRRAPSRPGVGRVDSEST